jgi:predicted transcriptional regulator YdeE
VEFDYMAGIPVSRAADVPEGMEAHTHPVRRCMPCSPTRARSARWVRPTRTSLVSWLDGYELAEADQIEWYDERFHDGGEDSEFDIYIPVKSGNGRSKQRRGAARPP